MSKEYSGLDHWITTDPADWLEAEERDEACRCMGRMMDDEFDYEADLERLTERLNYLRSLSSDINDEVPF